MICFYCCTNNLLSRLAAVIRGSKLFSLPPPLPLLSLSTWPAATFSQFKQKLTATLQLAQLTVVGNHADSLQDAASLPLHLHLWLQPASISKEVPLLAQSAAGSCGWTIKSFYCYAHTYSKHNTTQAAPGPSSSSPASRMENRKFMQQLLSQKFATWPRRAQVKCIMHVNGLYLEPTRNSSGTRVTAVK